VLKHHVRAHRRSCVDLAKFADDATRHRRRSIARVRDRIGPERTAATTFRKFSGGEPEHVEIAAHADVTAGERPKDVHRANVWKLPSRRDKTLESALEDRSKRLG